MQTIPDYTTPPGKILLLKVVHPDGRPESAHAPEDFRYPLVPGEEVVAPDWDASPRCGGGIHGWRDGAGDLSASDIHDQPDTTWLVLEADAADAVDLRGKIKVPRARVIAVGERSAVCSWLALRVRGPVHYSTVTAGYRGTATAGDCGTATAGYCGTATAGYGGTATAGYRGTATAGDCGTATAGYGGTATAGDLGTATAGYRGTATAGDGGTATAGYGGALVILWWDGTRYRRRCVEVDGVTILPGVPYKINDRGEFVRADNPKE